MTGQLLKQKDVTHATVRAIANIKRTKIMDGVKYPLLERTGWRTYFYFTKADGSYYTRIIRACMDRKKNKIVQADKLFCFEYDHKRDGWFIEDIPELIDHIEDLFEDYYKKYVEPEWSKNK